MIAWTGHSLHTCYPFSPYSKNLKKAEAMILGTAQFRNAGLDGRAPAYWDPNPESLTFFWHDHMPSNTNALGSSIYQEGEKVHVLQKPVLEKLSTTLGELENQVYYAGGPRGVNTPSSEPRTKGLQRFLIHGQAWLSRFVGLQGLGRLQRAGQGWVR